MAPRWEKKLFSAMKTGDVSAIAEAGKLSPDAGIPAALLEGMFSYQNHSYDRARELLNWLWFHSDAIDTNAFVSKYLDTSTLTLEVAHGVNIQMPLDHNAVGLVLAELLQEADELPEAIAVVEALDASTAATVSRAKLYSADERHQDVIKLTDGVVNVDDPTTFLLTLRGAAFRETHNYTAARAAFKEALKSSKRDRSIRHLAWMERARTYMAEGKKAMARKDLERILAEDSDYPDLDEAMQNAQ